MKIVIVTSSLAKTDGWGRYSFEIVNELKKYTKVKVLSHKPEDMEGIELYPILPSPLSSPAKLTWYLPKILRYLKDCDVIHCFVEPYAPVVALSNIFFRKPFFITAHGTYAVEPLSHLVGGGFLRFAFKRADRVLCRSKFTESEILKRVSLDNTLVLSHAVDYKRFQKYAGVSKDTSKRIILSVGAIKPRKGFDVSLRAFGKVREDVPDIEYRIIGEVSGGAFYDTLVRIANESGFSDDIHFLGNVSEDELIKLYYMADVFLLTPRNIANNFEGLGAVFLEAGACGKPVIASNSGGVTDAVIDEISGLVVPENDAEATAQALIKVLTDVALAKELGDNGRKRAKELSWDNYVKEIINIYEMIVKKRQTAR